MLKTLTTTNRNRVAYAKTLLFNTNRITDFYEMGTYAIGVITITDWAALIDGDAGDTIEVASVTFTFQAGAAGGGTAQIRAQTSNTVTAANVVTQINGYTAAGALDVNRITATSSAGVVTLTADIYGTAANAYTLAYVDLGGATPGIGATVSGATLLGGVASTTKFWYNERKNDRRDKADEYITSETYPSLKRAVDSDEILNARIEITATERNEGAFVETLNINIDDIIKVTYFDANESLLYLARGTFGIDKYRVTHTRAQLLALQNAIYKRGVAGTDVVAQEHGDGDLHKVILTLTDLTLTVTNASLGLGATIYTAPEGYIVVNHGISDLLISSDTNTDTPDWGLGTIVAVGAITALDASDVDMEDILDGSAATAITPAGSATTGQFNAEADNNPFDGSGTAMPIFLNFADAWGAAGDIVINGTITLWYRWVGDD